MFQRQRYAIASGHSHLDRLAVGLFRAGVEAGPKQVARVVIKDDPAQLEIGRVEPQSFRVVSVRNQSEVYTAFPSRVKILKSDPAMPHYVEASLSSHPIKAGWSMRNSDLSLTRDVKWRMGGERLLHQLQ